MNINERIERTRTVTRDVERKNNGQVERVSASLTVSSLASIYGCCGLFDQCGNGDLMSLSFPGAEPLLDVIGWMASDVCKISKTFIPWVRPTRDLEGLPTAGYLSDACADPNSAEFSTCNFELKDFGRLRHASPTRDITKATMRYCETTPRQRWDGRPITDDMEFGIRLATEVLLQDLKHYIITGNHATPGLFDGLQQLINSAYYDPAGVRCRMMDSIVVDWNSNDMDGGAGITWNGAAVGATFGIVDVLLAIYRRINAPAVLGAGIGIAGPGRG